ncbi:reverse transcriptase domain-containing protein [Tanacetum coccineum]
MSKYRQYENEAVRLMMFPLSLTGEAKAWLDDLNKGTIKTWDELRTAFISRFFPPALFDLLLREIRAFSQHENESLTDAWLRMKEMLRNCHGHNLSKGNIINFFYHVLNEITQEVLNAAASVYVVSDDMLGKDCDALLDGDAIYSMPSRHAFRIMVMLSVTSKGAVGQYFSIRLKKSVKGFMAQISPSLNKGVWAGLEVDKAKIDVILKLPPPDNIKEFDIEIKDKKGIENVAADHLFQIENDKTSDDSEVDDNFPGETLMEINTRDEPWFADFANYLFEYILVVVDHVSKWAEAQALPTNDARVVITFLKKLFCRFRMPKALISNQGTHYNKMMKKTMKRYGVSHRFSTSYHPQTSGQVENTNRALKRILEKTVKDNPTIWSRKLDDALWAFLTAYKTPTDTTPYKIVYGKNYHLSFEIEHRAYWALKNCNPDLIVAGEK